MSAGLQAVFGVLLLALGSVKTWLHMGTVPVLSLPMCSGETMTIELNQASWLAQAHCWGCYAFVAGMLLSLFALYRGIHKRRSVAVWMD